METEIILQLIQQIQESVSIINGELGEVQISTAILTTQMTELMWWFRAIAGGLIIWVVAQIGRVVLWVRNGRNKK